MKYTLASSALSYIFHNQHKTLNNLYIDSLFKYFSTVFNCSEINMENTI